MSGARHRRKGDRIEREIVDRHKALGLEGKPFLKIVVRDNVEQVRR
jgi:hypothetical protein